MAIQGTKGTLTKLFSSHDRLRTNEVTGTFQTLPTVGQGFEIYAEPLDPAMAIRYVGTSPVKSVEENGKTITFETANSKYTLTILE